MSDLFFVLKSFAVTIVIVVLMQIKVGQTTIEQHSLSWIHTSATVDNLADVAHGAVKATQRGLHNFTQFFDTHASSLLADEERPGSRLSKWKARHKTDGHVNNESNDSDTKKADDEDTD